MFWHQKTHSTSLCVDSKGTASFSAAGVLTLEKYGQKTEAKVFNLDRSLGGGGISVFAGVKFAIAGRQM